MNVSGLVKATRYEMIVVASNGKVEQSSDKMEILTAGGAGKNGSLVTRLFYVIRCIFS